MSAEASASMESDLVNVVMGARAYVLDPHAVKCYRHAHDESAVVAGDEGSFSTVRERRRKGAGAKTQQEAP
jgi:hypothetical protein